jgi:hypothetical protein
LARAIAAAEAAEFDRLRARRPDQRPPRPYRRQDKRLRKPRADQWTGAQLALLHRSWADGVPAEVIAIKLGKSAGAVVAKAEREGLQGRRRTIHALPPPAAAPGAA